MATRKTAPPSAKAPVSRALTLWEEKMSVAAAKSAKAERAVGGLKGINTKGGILVVDEKPVPGNELDVVILVAVHENQYHAKAYDPNVPQVPDCYAFGDPEADDPEGTMAPHEQSADKQGDDNGLCANCWANGMGSAEQGRGKACKNVRRLALVTADAIGSAEDMAESEVRVLKVPVMSVRGWAAYIKSVLKEDLNRPYWGVVTTIKPVPDPKSQFRLTFAFKELIDFDDPLFTALEKKIKEVTPQLTAPYVQMAEAPPPPPPRGRAPGRAAPEPLRPQGRAAEAMAKSMAKKTAPAATPAAGGRKPKY